MRRFLWILLNSIIALYLTSQVHYVEKLAVPTNESRELVLKLAGLQTKLSKRLDSSLSAHGISFTDFMVVFHLEKAPNKTMRRIDLAEKIGLSASGVTRLLNPMQKIGLVEKEESARDARVSLVKITSSGEKIYRDAGKTVNHCAEKFLAPLKDKRRFTLAAIVEELSQ